MCAQPISESDTAIYDAPTDQMAKLRIHGSSVLFRTKPQFVVFYQVQQSDSGWYEMQGVTAVQPEWLVEVAPHMYAKRGM